MLLLVAAGLFWWKSVAHADRLLPVAPMATSQDAPLADPPAASEKTREEKRFARYDRDRNGSVSRDEYLSARHKAFAKLDTDHDGKLSFEEYAVKTTMKFAGADADHSGVLSGAEFATTRVVRKARARPDCGPAAPAKDGDGE